MPCEVQSLHLEDRATVCELWWRVCRLVTMQTMPYSLNFRGHGLRETERAMWGSSTVSNVSIYLYYQSNVSVFSMATSGNTNNLVLKQTPTCPSVSHPKQNFTLWHRCDLQQLSHTSDFNSCNNETATTENCHWQSSFRNMLTFRKYSYLSRVLTTCRNRYIFRFSYYFFLLLF